LPLIRRYLDASNLPKAFAYHKIGGEANIPERFDGSQTARVCFLQN